MGFFLGCFPVFFDKSEPLTAGFSMELSQNSPKNLGIVPGFIYDSQSGIGRKIS